MVLAAPSIVTLNPLDQMAVKKMRYEPVANNIWSGVIKQNYLSSTFVVGGKLAKRLGELALWASRAPIKAVKKQFSGA